MVLVECLDRTAVSLYTNVYIPSYLFYERMVKKYNLFWAAYDLMKKMEDPSFNDKPDVNEYDAENDVIRVNYTYLDTKYVLCVERTIAEYNICDVHKKLLEQTSILEGAIMDATLNDEISLTDRVNSYFGNKGCHLDYTRLKVRWLLTPEEIGSFQKLVIMDSMCSEYEYTNIDEYLEIEML